MDPYPKGSGLGNSLRANERSALLLDEILAQKNWGIIVLQLFIQSVA